MGPSEAVHVEPVKLTGRTEYGAEKPSSSGESVPLLTRTEGPVLVTAMEGPGMESLRSLRTKVSLGELLFPMMRIWTLEAVAGMTREKRTSLLVLMRVAPGSSVPSAASRPRRRPSLSRSLAPRALTATPSMMRSKAKLSAVSKPEEAPASAMSLAETWTALPSPGRVISSERTM